MIADDEQSDVVSILARYPAVDKRRLGEHRYDVVTRYAGPAAIADMESAWLGRSLPQGLVELWSQVSSALLLFSEGANGLRILSPSESRTASDRIAIDHEVDEEFFHEDDIVVGEFQGYDSLIVFSSDEGWMVTGESGDCRGDWVCLGPSLDRFLDFFLQVDGDGDWETPFIIGSREG